ncbi:hypothetical protein GW17_00044037 [Ensete ventricosum]|nr:hypothetical protein GW17_00044037 [Ensete ventricosum]
MVDEGMTVAGSDCCRGGVAMAMWQRRGLRAVAVHGQGRTTTTNGRWLWHVDVWGSCCGRGDGDMVSHDEEEKGGSRRGLPQGRRAAGDCWGRRRCGWATVSSNDRAMAEGWRGRRQWRQREERPAVVAAESKGGSG